MTSIIEDTEASYHKPFILHCAFCVLMARFQLTFFSNCITIIIIITIINVIIIITIITLITIMTIITIIYSYYSYYYYYNNYDYSDTRQVGLGLGVASWPSNRATVGSNPKGTRLIIIIIIINEAYTPRI